MDSAISRFRARTATPLSSVHSLLSSAWRQRSSGERLGMVSVCALLSAVVLFLALEPLVEERRRLSGEIPGLREDLAWMQAHLGKAGRLRGPATEDEAQALSPALLETLMEEAGMRGQVSAMQPLAGQGISIRFDDVNFTDLLALISRLQDEARARVTNTRVSELEDRNGRVMAELTLLPG